MPRTSRTPKKRRSAPDWADRFLAAIGKTGNITAACKAAKVGRTTVYQRRDADEAFAARLSDALEASIDSLELEARRRAHDGCDRPVFQGGKQVGLIREYSDTLLIFLLKSHRPEKYRETIRQEHTGANGGPIRHVHDLTDSEIDARVAELESRILGASGAQGGAAVA